MPIATKSTWFLMKSTSPRKYPAKVKLNIQMAPPKRSKERNLEYFMTAIPATKGEKVLTIGTNRAIMMVFGPCFSKKA